MHVVILTTIYCLSMFSWLIIRSVGRFFLTTLDRYSSLGVVWVSLNRFFNGRNLCDFAIFCLFCESFFHEIFQKEYFAMINSCRIHWVLYTFKFSPLFVKKLRLYHKIEASNSTICENLFSLLQSSPRFGSFLVVLFKFRSPFGSFCFSLGLLLGRFGSV